MSNVARSRVRIKPTKIAKIKGVVLDTVNLHFRGKTLPTGIRTAIERAHGRPIRIVPFWLNDARGNALLGHSIIVQRPQPATFKLLGRLQREHNATLSRVDCSYEWTPINMTHEQCVTWINEHVLQKDRRKGWLHLYEETVYWAPDGERGVTVRNLVLYPDRPSKIDGTPRAIKTEIRLHTPKTIKVVTDCEYADELIDLDPKRVWNACCRTTSFDLQQFKTKIIRETLRDERGRHIARPRRRNAYLEQYRATMHLKIEENWKRVQLDFVQRVKDAYDVDMPTHSHDVIDMPSHLTWKDTAYEKTDRTMIDNIEHLSEHMCISPCISRPRIRVA
jgi:hypothetical protein